MSQLKIWGVSWSPIFLTSPELNSNISPQTLILLEEGESGAGVRLTSPCCSSFWDLGTLTPQVLAPLVILRCLHIFP